MTAEERPIVFHRDGQEMLGILHLPGGACERGLLLVVGGPQYRVGSHRQFLRMARALAGAGIAVLRFDCRGMGDSGGRFPGFQHVGDDISAAMDAFIAACPGLTRIALWGLCDAASAGMFYAHTDPRVSGLVLVNPWARTDTGMARTHLRHYYLPRLAGSAFWRRLAQGEVRLHESVASFAAMVRNALGGPKRGAEGEEGADLDEPMPEPDSSGLPDRMRDRLARFQGPVLFLMSGVDLTAREFDGVIRGSRDWLSLMARPGVTRRDLPTADHTFSTCADLDEATRLTREWVAGL